MPVGKHAPHCTVNTKWKIVHMWTCSWTWSSSWCLLCFQQREGDPDANIHYAHQLKYLFHLKNSLLILPFSSSIYTCEAWDPTSSPSWWPWPFLTPGKQKFMGKEDNCRLYVCCLVLSYLNTSHQQVVPICSLDDTFKDWWVEGLCLVSPAVSLPLYLWPFNSYPPPFSIYYFPTLILLIPAFFFSVFPLGKWQVFHRKTFSSGMNLSIRKRINRITRC